MTWSVSRSVVESRLYFHNLDAVVLQMKIIGEIGAGVTTAIASHSSFDVLHMFITHQLCSSNLLQNCMKPKISTPPNSHHKPHQI